MGYNYKSAFEAPTLCNRCRNEIILAAITAYTSSHPGEKGQANLRVHVEQRTVEITGSEHVFYTFKELGFGETC